jgi:hypothetical protein
LWDHVRLVSLDSIYHSKIARGLGIHTWLKIRDTLPTLQNHARSLMPQYTISLYNQTSNPPLFPKVYIRPYTQSASALPRQDYQANVPANTRSFDMNQHLAFLRRLKRSFHKL